MSITQSRAIGYENLESSEQQQNQQDDDDETKAAAAIIAGAVERSAADAAEAAKQRQPIRFRFCNSRGSFFRTTRNYMKSDQLQDF